MFCGIEFVDHGVAHLVVSSDRGGGDVYSVVVTGVAAMKLKEAISWLPPCNVPVFYFDDKSVGVRVSLYMSAGMGTKPAQLTVNGEKGLTLEKELREAICIGMVQNGLLPYGNVLH